jgi:hypothetical protein
LVDFAVIDWFEAILLTQLGVEIQIPLFAHVASVNFVPPGAAGTMPLIGTAKSKANQGNQNYEENRYLHLHISNKKIPKIQN